MAISETILHNNNPVTQHSKGFTLYHRVSDIAACKQVLSCFFSSHSVYLIRPID
ncbi:hypothetical protein [Klebsiella phage GADU21]|nr:hypothetical protein [Klebsiella phage GADU21]